MIGDTSKWLNKMIKKDAPMNHMIRSKLVFSPKTMSFKDTKRFKSLYPYAWIVLIILLLFTPIT